MGNNDKQHKWRRTFEHSPAPKPSCEKPKEYVCEVSGSLMADPVIVTSGQTFERVSVQVCRDLQYTPILSDGSRPDFSNLIPNRAIKITILNWCNANDVDHPKEPDYKFVEAVVRTSMEGDFGGKRMGRRGSDTEFLINRMPERPSVNFDHAVTFTGGFRNNNDIFSTGEIPAIGKPSAPPMPLATRPASYSTSSSSGNLNPQIPQQNPNASGNLNSQNRNQNPNPSLSEEEDEFLFQMQSPEPFEQEQGVIALRRLTRSNEEARVSLCTPRLLSALQPLILSGNSTIQTNAMATLVNLSLQKVNKVKIVRSGMVPPLLDVLRGGFAESQEHAAGAIFSLALDDDNKMAIGVLGGLNPLLHALSSESDRTRHDSALALYHLSFIQSNRVKLVKLGAVNSLLTLLRVKNMSGRVILVLCNLAACNEGKSAMLDLNAVESLVEVLKDEEGLVDSETTRENVVVALFSMSHGSLRFKGLARDAGAVEVLRKVAERGTERAKEKAKRLLQMMRGREEEEDDDWEGVLDSGSGVSRTRYRVGLGGPGRKLNTVNSTEF